MPRVNVWGVDEDGEVYPVLDDVSVDFVSFINSETHGIPALLAGRTGGTTVEAEKGQKILYVNTALVPLMEVEK